MPVSPVFQEMFENVEDDQNFLKLDDVSPQTLETLENIMLKNTIKAENITKGLCEFSDKFNIQPLVKICADHYRTSINTNNLLETMKIGG